MKQKMFSLTRKDFEWEFVRGSGKGGQKRNKTSSAVRCQHIPSKSMGWSEDGRSQHQNRQTAFRRCVESKTFQNWLRVQIAKQMGHYIDIEKQVELSMRPENLLIEEIGTTENRSGG